MKKLEKTEILPPLRKNNKEKKKTYGVKSFKPMLPKCFSFLQLCMCFALLKNYKLPIFNAAMAIKTIVSVK